MTISHDADAVLERFADNFSWQSRSPVMHTPGECDLDYQDVTFPARDGVALEGWLIPASGSQKLVIANHPMGFTRAGLPTHLEPWHSIWAPSGNGFEVNFVPDYKILHDAGYNVLAYDLRNHGLSGQGNGGLSSSGIFEARDVAGSVDFVRSRPDTSSMSIALFSRCLGASSTFAALTQFPELEQEVDCLIAVQPVTARTIIQRRLDAMGLSGRIQDLEQLIVLRTGIGFQRRNPREWAKGVYVPTLIYQVHQDKLTQPGDVQTMFDNIASPAKKLLWITGTTARWDGYLEFQRRPQPMLEWLETYLSPEKSGFDRIGEQR